MEKKSPRRKGHQEAYEAYMAPGWNGWPACGMVPSGDLE